MILKKFIKSVKEELKIMNEVLKKFKETYRYTPQKFLDDVWLKNSE